MTNQELEQIYNESYKAVFWTAMALLKNEDDAEDVVQDTFISFIESYGSITYTGKVVSLLKKIAANKCLDRIKLARTDSVENEFFEDVEALPEDFLPESLIESDEMRKVIMNIINNVLSDDIRRTLVLFYFDEMSTKEISEVMGIPQGTVLWRLSFAKKRIKKEVEKYEKDNDTKLFGMAAIPFLTKLFEEESKFVAFKPMPNSLINLSASTQAAGSETGIQAASKAAGKGSGLMMKKIIIGCIAATLGIATMIGAFLGIAVLINKKNTNPSSDSSIKRINQYKDNGNDENNRDDRKGPLDPEDDDTDDYVDPWESYKVDPVTGFRLIIFGKYRNKKIEWLILDENENGMLLLSKKAIEGKEYHIKNTEITWENCSLRKWMNNEFYNEAFSSEEKNRVLLSELVNYDGPSYNAKVVNSTEDHVFLLNYQDIERYFYHTKELLTEYEDYLTKDDIYNSSEKNHCCLWWLRTPANNDAYRVTGVSAFGNLSDSGITPINKEGIRPAIWLSHKTVKAGEKASPTASPEQVKDRTVTVEDAYRKDYKSERKTLVNRYPKVTISGVDTSAINSKMKHELKQKIVFNEETGSYSGMAVDYEYYVSDKYVSIVARLKPEDEENCEYKVYNISKATGRELLYGRLILETGKMRQERFIEKATKIFSKIGAGSDDVPDDVKKAIVKKNKARADFFNLQPFFSKNGRVCFVATVSYYANGEEKEHVQLFDATESKLYHWDERNAKKSKSTK